MSGLTVYVVNRTEDYESDNRIAAFTDRESAEALVASCYLYEKSRPVKPSRDESNDSWMPYLKRIEDWSVKHPGGKYARAHNTFSIEEIAVDQSPDKPPKAPHV